MAPKELSLKPKRPPGPTRAPSSLGAAMRQNSPPTPLATPHGGPASPHVLGTPHAPEFLREASVHPEEAARISMRQAPKRFLDAAGSTSSDADPDVEPELELGPPGGPPVRSLELVRAKFIQVLGIDAIKQTFIADVFFELKIRGGAHDVDLTREGDGPPTTHFPQDTLRPSARWYLNQIEFSNSVIHHQHSDTTVVTRGNDLHLRYRAIGEFSEQLELEDFPFDTQELTVKLIVHCVMGGFVGTEIVPPDFIDSWTVGPHGMRSIPRERYDSGALLAAPPQRIAHDRFKVDSFHLHNVWDMSEDVTGTIGVHASEFPELRMTSLVRRKPDFYLWNVVATMILLQVMSFAAYALDATDIEGLSGRISLTVTLVLTCGIYRSANAQFSPPVATLTLLDEYVLLSALIIGLTVLFHAIGSYEAYKAYEPQFIQLHVAVLILQHIYTFGIRMSAAARTSRELGFVQSKPGPLSLSRQALRRWRVGRHVVNVVRVFSSEQGKYVEVAATAVEADEAEH